MRSAFIRNREISLLDKLWHRNIVNLLDVIYLEEEQEDSFLLVLDWVPTSLDSLLDAFSVPFDAAQFKAVAWQLIEGIAYIHENGIIHRDISPNNVLITLNGIVKLSDFGSATLVSPNRKYEPALTNSIINSNMGTLNSIHNKPANSSSITNEGMPHNVPSSSSHMMSNPIPPDPSTSASYLEDELTPNVCTLWYRAPEILIHKDYGYEVDCWSYGCLLMEMATGEPIFPGNSEVVQLNLIDDFFKNATGGVPPSSLLSSSASATNTSSSANPHSKLENGTKRLRLIDVRDPEPFNKSAVQQYLEQLKNKQLKMKREHNDSKSSRTHTQDGKNDRTSTNHHGQSQNTPITAQSQTTTDHNFIALMEGLLTYNPGNRLLAKDVIQHGFFYKLPYPCSNIEILSGVGPKSRQ